MMSSSPENQYIEVKVKSLNNSPNFKLGLYSGKETTDGNLLLNDYGIIDYESCTAQNPSEAEVICGSIKNGFVQISVPRG